MKNGKNNKGTTRLNEGYTEPKIENVKSTYVEPIKEVLEISPRIKKEFEERGIDGVLSKLNNFSENDYCGFVYYILSLNEDNKNISKYITNYFDKLRDMGIRKKLSKDVYLRIYKKLNEDKINILLINSLNLFNELDDGIVNMIVEYNEVGSWFILYFIDSFIKIDVEKVLKKFFEFFNNGGVDEKERKVARKRMIKDLLKAGYKENVYKHLEDFGISEKDFSQLAEGVREKNTD